MKKVIVRRLALIALSIVPMAVSAQSDFGIWTSIGAEKKINKKWSVGLEGEWRTRNNLHTNDRWSVGVDGTYKPLKWLKFGAGYTLIYNNIEKITYHDDADEIGQANYGKPNKRANYWGVRHRFHVEATGDVDLGRFNLSLRERWQYYYRPEKTVDERYDYDDDEMDGKPKTYSGKGKNVLRSRLQVAYDIPNCTVEPYVSGEIYNSWEINKARYTAGAEWKITKQHVVDLYYRYQKSYNDDDETAEHHILGISYKFKF